LLPGKAGDPGRTGADNRLFVNGCLWVPCPEFEVMEPLVGAPSGLRAEELSSVLGWDKSRLAHLTKRMEQRGLVRRDASSHDGRGAIINITSEGMELLQQAEPSFARTVRSHFLDHLSREERAVLADVSARLSVHLASQAAHTAEAGGDLTSEKTP